MPQRVVVLPTGKMELRGLGVALTQRFQPGTPGCTFETVAWIPATEEPYAGFTSGSALSTPGPTARAYPALIRLVRKAISLAEDPSVALVLIVDDLELENVHQPGVVAETVGFQFAQELWERHQHEPQRLSSLREALRHKVSFHLAVPMIEAWLFADPAGPKNAGARAAALPAALAPGRDPEALRLQDPAYLTDDGAACVCWQGLSLKKQSEHRPLWLREGISPRRAEHPKAAMSWLCLDGEERKCSSYKETEGGADALAKLDWSAALACPEHMSFLRALNNDVALLLSDPGAFSLGREAPETTVKLQHPNRTLRNV